jgi:hypothetical protein
MRLRKCLGSAWCTGTGLNVSGIAGAIDDMMWLLLLGICCIIHHSHSFLMQVVVGGKARLDFLARGARTG